MLHSGILGSGLQKVVVLAQQSVRPGAGGEMCEAHSVLLTWSTLFVRFVSLEGIILVKLKVTMECSLEGK